MEEAQQMNETVKKWEYVMDKKVMHDDSHIHFDWSLEGKVPVTRTDIPDPLFPSDSDYDSTLFHDKISMDINPVKDVFCLHNILSQDECDHLIQQCHNLGYTFWDESENPSIDFRTAWTLECNHRKLADLLWNRVKDAVPQEITFSGECSRSECDTVGTWVASGVNPVFIFAYYKGNGHFGPHTDGVTVMNVNERSFFPFLVYLNTPVEGGETAIIRNEQQNVSIPKDDLGRYTANPDFIFYKNRATVGDGFCFFQSQMHEGYPVHEHAEKYIIRTDIVYTRKEPILTSPTDKEAFKLWQQAQKLSETGKIDEALKLFKRCFKMSQGLADLYGM